MKEIKAFKGVSAKAVNESLVKLCNEKDGVNKLATMITPVIVEGIKEARRINYILKGNSIPKDIKNVVTSKINVAAFWNLRNYKDELFNLLDWTQVKVKSKILDLENLFLFRYFKSLNIKNVKCPKEELTKILANLIEGYKVGQVKLIGHASMLKNFIGDIRYSEDAGLITWGRLGIVKIGEVDMEFISMPRILDMKDSLDDNTLYLTLNKTNEDLGYVGINQEAVLKSITKLPSSKYEVRWEEVISYICTKPENIIKITLI